MAYLYLYWHYGPTRLSCLQKDVLIPRPVSSTIPGPQQGQQPGRVDDHRISGMPNAKRPVVTVVPTNAKGMLQHYFKIGGSGCT